MRKLLALAGLVVLGSVMVSVAAGARSAVPLSAHQEPLLGHLLAVGDRVEIGYQLETPGVTSPAGWLYVRNNLQRRFERLPMKVKRGAFHAVVPGRLIRGQRLFYYAVIEDAQRGRAVTVPAAGRRAPEVAWILARPIVVRLGTHRFGHPPAPEAVVARAGAGDVGWQTEGDVFGPETFLVGRDRSIWLDDGLNNRLLVWRAGHPDAVERSVPLPSGSPDSDIALGPSGSVYATVGVGRGVTYHRELVRLSAGGEVRWQARLADPFGSLATNVALRLGPDGTLYCVLGRPGSVGAERGWMPVATPGGRPLSAAEQRRRNLWPFQPVAGGLRLVSDVYTPPHVETAPHEARFALIDRRGRVVRAWRVFSRTDINFNAATPELVGRDPVVVLDATAGAGRNFKWEYVVLRLGARGTRARLSLPRAVYGDNLLADLRVGPDGNLYQLGSSPTTGVMISRYSLGPAR